MPAAEPHPKPSHTVTLRQRVELGPETVLAVDNLVVEEIAASPDDPESYPAGSGLSLVVVVTHAGQDHRAELTSSSAGYDSTTTAWFEPYPVTLLGVDDPHHHSRVSLLIERITDRVTSAPAVTLRVTRERELELDPRTRIRLLFHGHKITVGDEPSPLLAAVELSVEGEDPQQLHLTLGPERQSLSWSWRDFRFTLVDHAYGEWMDLLVERLALERVPASP